MAAAAGILRRALCSEAARLLFCQLLLVGLILTTFWPSLHHVFRADHWKYLSYVRNTEGFLDTWGSTYSLARQTDYGDSHLFRPLLFACLALQRSLFSSHFQDYQVVDLVLHAANTCLLFLVLCRLVRVTHPATKPAAAPQPAASPADLLLPLAASALFAVNVPGSEMVIWNHIVAYQVWILLFLLVLYGLLAAEGGQQLGKAKLFALCCAIFCMSLIYEITIPIGVVLAGLAAQTQNTWKNKGKVFLWFLSPLLLSAAVNAVDYLHWRRPMDSAGQTGPLLPLLGRVYYYLVIQPFFPELNHPQAGLRTFLPIAKPGAGEILLCLALGFLLAAALFSNRGGKDRAPWTGAMPWGLAMALIVLVHGMLIATRLVLHPMGLTLLWGSSYYCHFFVIYVLVGCVALMGGQAASAPAWWRIGRHCLSLACLAVALNSAVTTHRLCDSYAVQSRPVVECSTQIATFIEQQLAAGASPRIGCATTDANNLGLCSLDQLLDLYPRYHALVEEQATHLAFYRDGRVEIVPK